MKLNELVNIARDTITVRRVFAEPYERNGVTVIAGAAVSGGGGGGGGHDDQGQEGEGGGFGASARPVGAFVIRDRTVQWRPAVDLNRLATVAGVVAVVFLLTRARARRLRAGRARAGRLRAGGSWAGRILPVRPRRGHRRGRR